MKETRCQWVRSLALGLMHLRKGGVISKMQSQDRISKVGRKRRRMVLGYCYVWKCRSGPVRIPMILAVRL